MEGTVSNLEVCNLAYAGNFDQLKKCISSDKSLASKTDQDRRTALHWACSAGHTEIVEFLLDLDVEVNLKDDASWSPLHIAASAGREEIVKALITKGAQLNSVNQNGCTPLHYAASKDRYEIAQMLLENGADPNITDKLESTPLHRASAKGNFRLIQLLLRQSASTNIQDSEGNTALRWSVGDVLSCITALRKKLFLSLVVQAEIHLNLLPDGRRLNRWLLGHLACDEERVEVAKLLVEHGASIYIENKEEKTPLQIAKGGLASLLRRMVEG